MDTRRIIFKVTNEESIMLGFSAPATLVTRIGDNFVLTLADGTEMAVRDFYLDKASIEMFVVDGIEILSEVFLAGIKEGNLPPVMDKLVANGVSFDVRSNVMLQENSAEIDVDTQSFVLNMQEGEKLKASFRTDAGIETISEQMENGNAIIHPQTFVKRAYSSFNAFGRFSGTPGTGIMAARNATYEYQVPSAGQNSPFQMTDLSPAFARIPTSADIGSNMLGSSRATPFKAANDIPHMYSQFQSNVESGKSVSGKISLTFGNDGFGSLRVVLLDGTSIRLIPGKEYDIKTFYGNLVINKDCSFTFAANRNTTGNEKLVFTLTDGNGDKASSVLAFDITAPDTSSVPIESSIVKSGEPVKGTMEFDMNANKTKISQFFVVIDNCQYDLIPGEKNIVPTANGVLTVFPDGSYSFQSKVNYSGKEVFNFYIKDIYGGEISSLIEISIKEPPAPEPPKPVETKNGSEAVIDMPDYTIMDIAVQPKNGTIKQENGSWVYVFNDVKPSAPISANYDEGIADTFTVIVKDEYGNLLEVVMTVNVKHDKPAIFITEEAISAISGNSSKISGSLSFGFGINNGTGKKLTVVSENDNIKEVSGITVIEGKYGTLTINTDGSYSYKARPDAVKENSATDSFTFEITDSNGNKASTTLNINVEPAPAPEIPEDLFTDTILSDTLDIAVPGYTILEGKNGVFGTVTNNGEKWVYTLYGEHPDIPVAPDYDNGTQDTFKVLVKDDAGNTFEVSFDVNITNKKPAIHITNKEIEAISGNAGTTEGDLSFGFGMDNGEGKSLVVIFEGERIDINDVTEIDGQYGRLTIDPDGHYSYKAKPDAIRDREDTENFRFEIMDSTGDFAAAELNIKVIPAEPPSVTADVSLSTKAEDRISLDVEGYTTIEIVSMGELGEIREQDGNWTYVPDISGPIPVNYDEIRTDSFIIKYQDKAGNTFDMTFNPVVIHDTPAIHITEKDVEALSGQNGSLEGNLTFAFGIDNGDGKAITVSTGTDTKPVDGETVIAGKYGILTIHANGDYSYKAIPDAVRSNFENDLFTFDIIDATGDRVSTTLTIKVMPAVAPDLQDNIKSDEATFDAVNLEVPGYTIMEVISQGEHGVVSLIDGNWQYQLSHAINSGDIQGSNLMENADSITVKVKDEFENTFDVTFGVDIKDDVPELSITETVINAVSGRIGDVSGKLAFDYGADSNRDLKIHFGDTYKEIDGETVIDGQYGRLTISADGTYSYKAMSDAVREVPVTDSFTFRIIDADGDIAESTLTVNVMPAKAPDPHDNLFADESEMDVCANFIVDGYDIITVVQDGKYGTVQRDENGTWSYRLVNPVNSGLSEGRNVVEDADSFIVKVRDADENTFDVCINVNIQDDVPAIGIIQTIYDVVAGHDIPVAETLTQSFGADVEGAQLRIIVNGEESSLVAGSAVAGKYGSLTLNEDGTYSYVANPVSLDSHETGTDKFVFKIIDGDGDVAVSTPVSVTVSKPELPEPIITDTVFEKDIADDNARTSIIIANGYHVVGIGAETEYGCLVQFDGGWEFALQKHLQHTPDNDSIPIIITVGDNFGNVWNVSHNVKIGDDAPCIALSTVRISEENAISVGDGNVSLLNGKSCSIVLDYDFGSENWAGAGLAIQIGENKNILIPGETGTFAGNYGTFSYDGDRTLTYLANFLEYNMDFAKEKFSFLVFDADGSTKTHENSINVGKLPKPVFENISADESNMSAISEIVLPSENYRILGIAKQPAHGAATLENGRLTYNLTEAINSVGKNSAGVLIDGDRFEVIAGDSDGNRWGVWVNVDVKDAVPSVSNDFGAITTGQTSISSGKSVLDNDSYGADGRAATNGLVWSVANVYGTFTGNDDGTWSYALNNDNYYVANLAYGKMLFENVSYTIKDADGDTRTANLKITITGANHGINFGTTSTLSLSEANLATGTNPYSSLLTKSGSCSVWAIDGLSALQMIYGSSPITIPLNGNQVSMAVGSGTFYAKYTNGVIDYSYTLNSNINHGSSDSASYNVSIKATDTDGSTNTKTIGLTVFDDKPVIVNDTATIVRGTTSVTGNVLTNDKWGADGKPANGYITWGSQTGQYGTMTKNADGSWTYTLNQNHTSVANLGYNQTLTEKFSYTIKDGDGDSSSTGNLTVTIQGSSLTLVKRQHVYQQCGTIKLYSDCSSLKYGWMPEEWCCNGFVFQSSLFKNAQRISVNGLTLPVINGTNSSSYYLGYLPSDGYSHMIGFYSTYNGYVYLNIFNVLARTNDHTCRECITGQYSADGQKLHSSSNIVFQFTVNDVTGKTYTKTISLDGQGIYDDCSYDWIRSNLNQNFGQWTSSSTYSMASFSLDDEPCLMMSLDDEPSNNALILDCAADYNADNVHNDDIIIATDSSMGGFNGQSDIIANAATESGETGDSPAPEINVQENSSISDNLPDNLESASKDGGKEEDNLQNPETNAFSDDCQHGEPDSASEETSPPDLEQANDGKTGDDEGITYIFQPETMSADKNIEKAEALKEPSVNESNPDLTDMFFDDYVEFDNDHESGMPVEDGVDHAEYTLGKVLARDVDSFDLEEKKGTDQNNENIPSDVENQDNLDIEEILASMSREQAFYDGGTSAGLLFDLKNIDESVMTEQAAYC